MSDDQKNPLDVLEELLQKTKQQQGGVDQTATQEQEEAERLAQQQRFEEEQQRQAELDAQNIAAQRASLETLKDTPQYQARVAQDTEDAQTKSDALNAQDGFRIEQLKHTKV